MISSKRLYCQKLKCEACEQAFAYPVLCKIPPDSTLRFLAGVWRAWDQNTFTFTSLATKQGCFQLAIRYCLLADPVRVSILQAWTVWRQAWFFRHTWTVRKQTISLAQRTAIRVYLSNTISDRSFANTILVIPCHPLAVAFLGIKCSESSSAQAG